MWTEASAPSNIALIKYMGKADLTGNKPTNASLSYTLGQLRTFVRIKKNQNLSSDQWSAYRRNDLRQIQLSEKGLKKFLDHFSFLKNEFNIKGFFEIESGNNFPSDCGLASSASSFAALTLAIYDWAKKNTEKTNFEYDLNKLSQLSQKGSGSSCRSFFKPWAIWRDYGAEPVSLGYTNLKHQVILCDENIKSVSSSEAHKLVLTSDLFKGRPERAEDRLKSLVASLTEKNWETACRICWNEFWDMHALFHTSDPSFIYMNDLTMKFLRFLNDEFKNLKNGPLVTMDAGSNIHLLYNEDQKDLYVYYQKYFLDYTSVWTDEGYFEKRK